jgi:hypothetical protein
MFEGQNQVWPTTKKRRSRDETAIVTADFAFWLCPARLYFLSLLVTLLTLR